MLLRLKRKGGITMDNKVIFYTYPSCTSCRKAKAWLAEQGVSYEERHLYKNPPTSEELKNIITMTNNGTDEILSTRSHYYKNLDMDLDEMKFNDFVDFLAQEPKLLKRPILTSGDNLIVGYNKNALEEYFAS